MGDKRQGGFARLDFLIFFACRRFRKCVQFWQILVRRFILVLIEPSPEGQDGDFC